MKSLPTAALLALAALATLMLVPACTSTLPPPPPNAQGRAREQVEAAEMYEGSEAGGAPGVHGVALDEVLALRPKLAAGDRDEADRWIAGHVALFRELHEEPIGRLERAAHAAVIADAKVVAESPLRQAERRFARWTMETRYDRRNQNFARDLFLLPPGALPGVDRFALGIEAVQAGEAGNPGVAAFFILCGRSRALSEKLVAWVAGRHDPWLAQRVFDVALARPSGDECAHLAWSAERAVPEFVRLWNASVWWPELWTAGARALLATRVDLGDPLALSALHQAWLVWPERRATLLQIIGEAARKDGTFRGREPGETFAQKIGPRPTASEVMAMLALGPQTLPALPQIWWTSAQPLDVSLVARTIARSAGPRGSAPRDGAQQVAVVALATDMCRGHQRRGTETLRRELRRTGLEDLLVPRDVAASCRASDFAPLPDDRARVPGC